MLAALVTGTTLGSVGGNLMPVLLSGFAGRFALSDFEAGVVAAAQLLATAAAALALADRVSRSGRVTVARLGLVVAAVGFCGAWLNTSTATLVGANVVAGLGIGAVFAAAAAALSSTPDVDHATTMTVFVATLAIAALIIAVPAANAAAGATSGFAVLAACCLVGIWLVRGLPERPTEHVGLTGPPLSLAFLGAIVVFGATEQGAWSYTAVIGEREAGLSPAAVSTVLSVAAVAALLGVPLGAKGSAVWGRTRAMIAIFAVDSVAKLFVTGAPSAAAFSVATVVWQLCYLALLVQVLALAATLDRSGRWTAAAGGALAIGTGVGPAIVGGILTLTNGWMLGVYLLVTTAAAAAAVIVVARSHGVPERTGVRPVIPT